MTIAADGLLNNIIKIIDQNVGGKNNLLIAFEIHRVHLITEVLINIFINPTNPFKKVVINMIIPLKDFFLGD